MANGESSTRIKKNFKECLEFVSQKLTPVAYYACILLFLILMASILCIRKLQITFFDTKFCKRQETHKFCASLVGYGAVFRIFSAHALFHVILAIVTSEFWLFENWRETIHNGGWGVKVIMLPVFVFASLWIPSGSLFDKILPFVGFPLSFLTILVLMFVILNIVDDLLDQWIPDLDNLARESWTNPRFLLYLSIMSILYLFSTLSFIYCFFLFTNNTTCRLNLIFVSYVFSHSLIISTLTPFLQFKNKHSSKATPKSLCCSLYVGFICWLSMCANPQVECNPYIQDIKHPGTDSNAIINLIILLIVLCHMINNPGKVLAELGQSFKVKYRDQVTKSKRDSPQEKTDYNSYTTFHLLVLLLSLYFMSSATNWHQANIVIGQVTYVKSQTALAVLMSATITCLWVFSWILVKHILNIFVNSFKKLLFGENKGTSSGIEEAVNFEEINEHVLSDASGQPPTTVNSLDNHKEERTDNSFNKSKPNIEDFLLESDAASKSEMDIAIEQEKDISMDQREKEIIRLQEKVLRLQEKICRLQQKVSTLQGVSL